MDIYLDDYHLYSTSTWLPTSVARPLQGVENASQRLDVSDNPGRGGQGVGNTLNGSSLITLAGSIRTVPGNDATRASEYESARQDLIRILRPKRDATGRTLPFTLTVVTPGGTTYRASVYKQGFTAPIEYATYGTWVLHLLNPLGVFELPDLQTTIITLPQGGGLKFPVRFPLHFGSTSGGTGTATNAGTADVYPVVTFYGPMDHPVLYNDTLGLYTGLNLTLAAGDLVVMDTFTPTVVGGTTSTTPTTGRMGALTTGSSYDYTLPPGDTGYSLRANSFDSGRVEISWRSAVEGF